jgi:2-succinyl-6-hydroxy-2,4-cyclohexadiene-1-carboxylate synthase
MTATATAIVALHGNIGSTSDWEDLPLPNLRAIPLWEHAPLSFPEFAYELAHDLTEGLEQPILAGYSLGGRLALHAMAAYPERWSGAVILSAHPGLFCVEDKVARRISDEIWARDARGMPWPVFLEKWNGQPVFGKESEIPPDQASLESQREAIALAFENWSLGRQDDLREKLKSFRAPVLWITGSEDAKFTALGAEIKAVFPDCEHRILPGAGHRLLSGNREIVCDWIRTFSDSVERGLT